MNYKTAKELEEDKDNWLNMVKAGNESALKQLYFHFRNDFVFWIQKKTSCQEVEALDVFQESVFALYENIIKGKLTSFSQSLRAYLFTIGKYTYLQKIRKKRVDVVNLDWEVDFVEPAIAGPEEYVIENEQQQLILSLLKKMKEPCATILYAVYYEKKKLKQIAEELGYLNSNVVKVQKARCMNRLRETVSKIEDRLR